MTFTRKKSAPGKSGRDAFTTPRTIEADIDSLRDKPVSELRDYWARRFRKPAPPIQAADILHRLIAWKLQVETYGDLDSETQQALSRLSCNGSTPGTLAASPMSPLRPGSVLIREWRGVKHRVLVLDNAFEHDGKRYSSLTQIARHITGTRWSGPRFFGVDQTAGPGARPVAKSVRSK